MLKIQKVQRLGKILIKIQEIQTKSKEKWERMQERFKKKLENRET